MPSSLVFAALVVAWLAVLVPVVARRRQTVPRPAEAHLSARVLARPDRSASTTTTAAMTAAATTTAIATAEPETDTAPEIDSEDTHAPGADAPQGRVLDRGRGRRPFRDDAGEDEGMDDRDEGRLATADREDDGYDGYDEHGYDEHGYDDGYGPEDDLGDEAPGPYDVADHHARSYRPGRGGFDADAAAAAAHTRYAFRQRVAVGLVAVAVLSLLAALVVTPTLWWLHLATDLGLVGYLVFLRRQTRIEDEVRRRRLARLTGERRALEARQERQADHEDRLADAERWDVEDDTDDLDDGRDLDEDLDDLEEEPDDGVDVPSPRWIAPRTPAPAVPAGMELVADTDEDPDFHDLSDSRVPAYRRMAAGA
ncbi:gephyrin-like molybdotransferase receptor GlpR [Actinomycetospora sp.]|uniref:divisome protein SepX/GlpR n=1 Tax=Actinomycetospora sp. TaxID=1872135 RepID=UPI002F3F3EE5